MIRQRTLQETDREWLANEIAHDPLHSKNGTTPDFFFTVPNTFSVCFEDEQGPLFVNQYGNVLKVNIQFCRESASRKRIVTGFMEEFPTVLANAKERGYNQLLVNTESPELKHWCEKHLGFVHLSHDLSRFL